MLDSSLKVPGQLDLTPGLVRTLLPARGVSYFVTPFQSL